MWAQEKSTGPAPMGPRPAPAVPRATGRGLLQSLPLTLRYMRDPPGTLAALRQRHGDVVELSMFGQTVVLLMGVDAEAGLLLAPPGTVSAVAGWDPLVAGTFPNGLLSMDGAQHREDRRLIGVAFKPDRLRAQHDAALHVIEKTVAAWPRRLIAYPAIKRLTLDIAARSLLGIPLGERADRVSRAFERMLGGGLGLLPAAVPGSRRWLARRGRGDLHAILRQEIAARRRAPTGDDLLSTLAQAVDTQGRTLPAQWVLDHVSLLLMAAHDTTTSALSSTLRLLALHPHWLASVVAEIDEHRRRHGPMLDHDRLGDLVLLERVLREALRLFPPILIVPRGLAADTLLGGFALAAGTGVTLSVVARHRDPAVWPDPDRFDPDRFLPAAMAARGRGSWLPFGLGAHTCLGLHSAMNQMKAILFTLLSTRSLSLAPGARRGTHWLPMPRPADGLRLILEPRQGDVR